MIHFFISGGLFMWILLILLVINVVIIVRQALDAGTPATVAIDRSGTILFLGMLSLILGMFAQILGIQNALNAIIVANDISPEIVIKGYQQSFHTTLFGFVICIVSALTWLILRLVKQKSQ